MPAKFHANRPSRFEEISLQNFFLFRKAEAEKIGRKHRRHEFGSILMRIWVVTGNVEPRD